MITRQEALSSLHGAWRLFLRDPRGLDDLDDSIEGFWKSFYCAAIVLPGYLFYLAFGPATSAADAGTFRLLTVMGIAYVVMWVAWPLAMAYIAPALGKDHRYVRYVVAYNWSAFPRTVIDVVLIAIFAAGLLPEGLFFLCSLLAFVVILAYDWFILRVALEVSVAVAAGLVLADFVLGYTIHSASMVVLH